MSRPAWITAAIFGGFVFLVITFMLTRGLSGAGVERSDVLDLVRAQAAGDADGVLEQLPECRRQPACVASTRARVRALKRPGKVEILNFQPSARLTLGEHIGPARVAWRAGESLPVVQCVRVRRESPFRGGAVELIGISAPIAGEGSCV